MPGPILATTSPVRGATQSPQPRKQLSSLEQANRSRVVAEERRTVAKVLEDKVLKISNEAGNSFCYCHAPSSKNLIGRREDKIAFLLMEKKYIFDFL